jgi:hypothetical protein
MGHHLSIDKYTSPLEDVLAISSATFKRVNIDKLVSPRITQHLKIWKFQKNEAGQIKSKPVPLHNLDQTGFVFSSTEAYLVLLVYRANTKEKVDVVSFPHSLWGLVESADKLTPRGLANPLESENDTSPVQSLDSFLLSKRENKEYNTNREYKYMLFVWNGKEADAMLKASALSRGFELDSLLNKAGDSLLSFIFNGGVIRGTKFQKGRVLVFDHASSQKDNDDSNENPNEPDTERVVKTFETVYLFNWLIPDSFKDKYGANQFALNHEMMDENDLQDIKLEDNHRYLKRFKWVDSDSQSARVNKRSSSSKDYFGQEKLNPQPILKLAFPEGMISSPTEKQSQQPAIPMLNIGGPFGEKSLGISKHEVSPQEQKAPGIKGLSLDMEKVAQKHSYVSSSSSSSPNNLYNDSNRSNESPNPIAPKGMGLDLSKAKEIQNQMLNQHDLAKKPAFNLAIPGMSNAPKLGNIPNRSSTSNSNEGEGMNYHENSPVEQNTTGPQLQINIKNITKLKDDVEMVKEEDAYEPPKHRRGQAQPDESTAQLQYTDIPSEVSGSQPEEFMMNNTSVTEVRNNKYKQICSEIIPSFLYLGSDYLAKDKDILTNNKI